MLLAVLKVSSPSSLDLLELSFPRADNSSLRALIMPILLLRPVLAPLSLARSSLSWFSESPLDGFVSSCASRSFKRSFSSCPKVHPPV